MNETSKAVMRRLHDSRFATRYFVGDGIDIGSGDDPLGNYKGLFPLMTSCRSWDKGDGDATFLLDVASESLDFVHSSHCLEHLIDPPIALASWLRVLKPGGHLIVTVPDEDLYEQGVWPSTFNPSHEYTFTIWKSESWSRFSMNVVELLQRFRDAIDILKVELLDATYEYGDVRRDQTLGIGECAIEFIVRKR